MLHTTWAFCGGVCNLRASLKKLNLKLDARLVSTAHFLFLCDGQERSFGCAAEAHVVRLKQSDLMKDVRRCGGFSPDCKTIAFRLILLGTQHCGISGDFASMTCKLFLHSLGTSLDVYNQVYKLIPQQQHSDIYKMRVSINFFPCHLPSHPPLLLFPPSLVDSFTPQLLHVTSQQGRLPAAGERSWPPTQRLTALLLQAAPASSRD